MRIRISFRRSDGNEIIQRSLHSLQHFLGRFRIGDGRAGAVLDLAHLCAQILNRLLVLFLGQSSRCSFAGFAAVLTLFPPPQAARENASAAASSAANKRFVIFFFILCLSLPLLVFFKTVLSIIKEESRIVKSYIDSRYANLSGNSCAFYLLSLSAPKLPHAHRAADDPTAGGLLRWQADRYTAPHTLLP